MIVPHTLLPRKRLVMKKGLKMVYAKQNKILLKKRNVLTNFSLLILSYHAQNKSPEEIAALCEQSILYWMS